MKSQPNTKYSNPTSKHNHDLHINDPQAKQICVKNTTSGIIRKLNVTNSLKLWNPTLWRKMCNKNYLWKMTTSTTANDFIASKKKEE